jgi:hypothetical protein
MNAMRPGYKTPDRKSLSTSLLDKVFEEVDNDMSIEINHQPDTRAITIMQDGWSNVRNDPLIVSSLRINGNPYILEARDCGTEKKTAEFCTKIVIEDINKCKAKYNKEVYMIIFL